MTGASTQHGIDSDTLGAIARQGCQESRETLSSMASVQAWSTRSGTVQCSPHLSLRPSWRVVELGRNGCGFAVGPLLMRRSKMASITEDVRGRWYFNIQIEIVEAAAKEGAVAIDLVLKHRP